MGLGNSRDQRKTYLTIFNGKFSRSAEPDEEGAVSRINKKDKLVWEMHYDTLSDVYIRNIEKKVGDFGAQWLVLLQDGDEFFEMQLSYNGSVTNGLFFRLPNIDIDQPVTFKIYHFEEGDKVRNSMVIYQHGDKVAPFFTKDEPNGVPEMEMVKEKGVDKLNDTKRYLYFEEMINQNYKPYFESLKLVTTPKAAATLSNQAPATTTAGPKVDGHPLAMEYQFMQKDGYKGTIADYERLKENYLEDCAAGFAGTIVDYVAYLANKSKPAEAAKPAATPPVTAKPHPMPGPKLGNAPVATSGGDQNFKGVPGATLPKGTTITDVLQTGYESVKRAGYAGSVQEFSAWCLDNGMEPNCVIYSEAEGLQPDGLPF